MDGTLGSRFCGTGGSGDVYAKTGTLTGVVALSGYLVNDSDGKIYMFSIMANNVSDTTATRQAADDLVLVLNQSGIPNTGAVPSGIIVDNGSAGYSETGAWASSTSTGYYGGGSRYAQAGSGEAVATWSATLPKPGKYEVLVWWVSGANRANNAPYKVAHAFGNYNLNANQTTSGGTWMSVGTHTFPTGSASVSLSNNAQSGTVVSADAVRFVYQGDSEITVDNTSSGYTNSGTWTASTGGGFYGTNSLYAVVGGAQDVSRWTPTLPGAGSYEVFTWWVEGTNRVTNAVYNINHRDGISNIPGNQTDNGGQWNSLGTFNFNGGAAGFVTMGDNGNGEVVSADAMRFVYRGAVTTPPPTPTATATPTATPAPTATPTATTTPTATPVPTSTPTATATATPTATPTVTPMPTTTPTATPAVTDIIVDNANAPAYQEAGTWASSVSAGYYGGGSRYAVVAGQSNAASWTPTIATTARYNVYVWYVAGTNRSTCASYKVTHRDGVTVFKGKTANDGIPDGINQTTGGSQWVLLGTYNFTAGTTGSVYLDGVNSFNDGSTSTVISADAVKLTYAGPATP